MSSKDDNSVKVITFLDEGKEKIQYPLNCTVDESKKTKTCQLSDPTITNIGQLKTDLEKQTGFPAQEQKLYYNNMELTNDAQPIPGTGISQSITQTKNEEILTFRAQGSRQLETIQLAGLPTWSQRLEMEGKLVERPKIQIIEPEFVQKEKETMIVRHNFLEIPPMKNDQLSNDLKNGTYWQQIGVFFNYNWHYNFDKDNEVSKNAFQKYIDTTFPWFWTLGCFEGNWTKDKLLQLSFANNINNDFTAVVGMVQKDRDVSWSTFINRFTWVAGIARGAVAAAPTAASAAFAKILTETPVVVAAGIVDSPFKLLIGSVAAVLSAYKLWNSTTNFVNFGTLSKTELKADIIKKLNEQNITTTEKFTDFIRGTTHGKVEGADLSQLLNTYIGTNNISPFHLADSRLNSIKQANNITYIMTTHELFLVTNMTLDRMIVPVWPMKVEDLQNFQDAGLISLPDLTTNGAPATHTDTFSKRQGSGRYFLCTYYRLGPLANNSYVGFQFDAAKTAHNTIVSFRNSQNQIIAQFVKLFDEIDLWSALQPPDRFSYNDTEQTLKNQFKWNSPMYGEYTIYIGPQPFTFVATEDHSDERKVKMNDNNERPYLHWRGPEGSNINIVANGGQLYNIDKFIKVHFREAPEKPIGSLIALTHASPLIMDSKQDPLSYYLKVKTLKEGPNWIKLAKDLADTKWCNRNDIKIVVMDDKRYLEFTLGCGDFSKTLTIDISDAERLRRVKTLYDGSKTLYDEMIQFMKSNNEDPIATTGTSDLEWPETIEFEGTITAATLGPPPVPAQLTITTTFTDPLKTPLFTPGMYLVGEGIPLNTRLAGMGIGPNLWNIVNDDPTVPISPITNPIKIILKRKRFYLNDDLTELRPPLNVLQKDVENSLKNAEGLKGSTSTIQINNTLTLTNKLSAMVNQIDTTLTREQILYPIWEPNVNANLKAKQKVNEILSKLDDYSTELVQLIPDKAGKIVANLREIHNYLTTINIPTNLITYINNYITHLNGPNKGLFTQLNITDQLINKITEIRDNLIILNTQITNNIIVQIAAFPALPDLPTNTEIEKVIKSVNDELPPFLTKFNEVLSNLKNIIKIIIENPNFSDTAYNPIRVLGGIGNLLFTENPRRLIHIQRFISNLEKRYKAISGQTEFISKNLNLMGSGWLKHDFNFKLQKEPGALPVAQTGTLTLTAEARAELTGAQIIYKSEGVLMMETLLDYIRNPYRSPVRYLENVAGFNPLIRPFGPSTQFASPQRKMLMQKNQEPIRATLLKFLEDEIENPQVIKDGINKLIELVLPTYLGFDIKERNSIRDRFMIKLGFDRDLNKLKDVGEIGSGRMEAAIEYLISLLGSDDIRIKQERAMQTPIGDAISGTLATIKPTGENFQKMVLDKLNSLSYSQRVKWLSDDLNRQSVIMSMTALCTATQNDTTNLPIADTAIETFIKLFEPRGLFKLTRRFNADTYLLKYQTNRTSKGCEEAVKELLNSLLAAKPDSVYGVPDTPEDSERKFDEHLKNMANLRSFDERTKYILDRRSDFQLAFYNYLISHQSDTEGVKKRLGMLVDMSQDAAKRNKESIIQKFFVDMTNVPTGTGETLKKPIRDIIKTLFGFDPGKFAVFGFDEKDEKEAKYGERKATSGMEPITLNSLENDKAEAQRRIKKDETELIGEIDKMHRDLESKRRLYTESYTIKYRIDRLRSDFDSKREKLRKEFEKWVDETKYSDASTKNKMKSDHKEMRESTREKFEQALKDVKFDLERYRQAEKMGLLPSSDKYRWGSWGDRSWKDRLWGDRSWGDKYKTQYPTDRPYGYPPTQRPLPTSYSRYPSTGYSTSTQSGYPTGYSTGYPTSTPTYPTPSGYQQSRLFAPSDSGQLLRQAIRPGYATYTDPTTNQIRRTDIRSETDYARLQHAITTLDPTKVTQFMSKLGEIASSLPSDEAGQILEQMQRRILNELDKYCLRQGNWQLFDENTNQCV